MKQYHTGYGYDLEMVMARYPIKEQLNESDKKKVVESLEKGNLVPVTFAREGGEDKMYIAANPQYKKPGSLQWQAGKAISGDREKAA